MERLTSSQIADFNNPLAFARSRNAPIGQSSVNENRLRGNVIRTTDAEESYRLILGAARRLETLEGNLTTMRQLADDGSRTRSTDQRGLEEVYGKLRSLSAGFDQVVEAITFKGNPVFTGDPVQLDLGPGTRALDLDIAKLLTYGEDSLQLSQSEATAEAAIQYRTEDRILNSGYDIIGLDISGASFNPDGNAALELEDGQYKVGISYEGANSSVELRTTTGAVIARQDGVDLSGSGTEWVDFQEGVRITFNKESFFSSFDKYDFETNGPAKLQATLNYRRLDAHTLRTGEAPPEDSVSFLYQTPLTIGNSSLAASDPVLSPVAMDQQQLESGAYNLEVEYHGENSVIRLTDGLGRLQAYQYGVDLSGDQQRQIDLGNGLGFTLTTENFNTEGASLTVPLQYNRAAPPLEDFDFRAYRDRIDEAISLVKEQRQIIADAQTQIEEANLRRSSYQTGQTPSVMSLNSSGALSILSGAGNSSLFGNNTASNFGAGNAAASGGAASFLSGSTAGLANSLFSTASALPAQANQSPQELASLQNSAASAGWLGNFA